MITILLIVYFSINVFMTGMYFSDSFLWDKPSIKDLTTLLFFGTLFLILNLISRIGIISWVKYEVVFFYRLYFTKYWDKMFLDDNYSEDFPDLLSKLDQVERIYRNGSKQVKRHAEIIKRRYEKRAVG